jgi:hypothetical protein
MKLEHNVEFSFWNVKEDSLFQNKVACYESKVLCQQSYMPLHEDSDITIALFCISKQVSLKIQASNL